MKLKKIIFTTIFFLSIFRSFLFASSLDLIAFIEQKQIEKVKELLPSIKNIDEKIYGKTALHFAAQIGDLEIIKLLLDKKASINLRDDEGNTAFLLASEKGGTELLKYLVEKGANPKIVNGEKENALFFASGMNNLEGIRYLVSLGLPINEKNLLDQTVLHYASRAGHSQMVKFLIDQGVNLDVADKNKKTAIVYSVEFLYPETSLLLVKAGADIQYKDKYQYSLLSLSLKMKNSIELIKELISRGADLKEKNYDSNLITSAAYYGNLEAIKILADKGVDPLQTNSYGTNALTNAIAGSHAPLVEYLLKKGANPNAKQYNDYIIFSASRWSSFEVFQLLVDSGADINVKNRDNESLINFAKKYCSKPVTDYLIKKGAK